MNNGRVDLKGPKTSDLFQMYDKIPVNQCATFRNPTEGLWNDTQLSDSFFSEKNIQVIQNGIREGVYLKSKQQYVIGMQDEDTLKIIMRSVFLQNSKNLPNNISLQVNELNKIVWNYCIQQVYNEAQGYMKYLNDASSMYTPMEHPTLAKHNDKQLELKSWF